MVPGQDAIKVLIKTDCDPETRTREHYKLMKNKVTTCDVPEPTGCPCVSVPAFSVPVFSVPVLFWSPRAAPESLSLTLLLRESW